MKSYFIALLAATLLSVLILHLAPEGERGGLSKHVRLVASLFVVCILLSPIQALIQELPRWLEGDWLTVTDSPTEGDAYKERMEEAIDQASKDYFTDLLTQALCAELSLEQKDLQCRVMWDPEKDEPTPTGVTVLLSGKAIWKDPTHIRRTVDALIGCPCEIIIE